MALRKARISADRWAARFVHIKRACFGPGFDLPSGEMEISRHAPEVAPCTLARLVRREPTAKSRKICKLSGSNCY